MKASLTQNSTLETRRFIDWHSHILPGLDDGAADLDEALAMARALAGAGFAEVHCTPHAVFGAYDTPPRQVRRAVRDLGRALEREGIPLRLTAGTEYYCDEFLSSRLDDPLPLGSSNLILMEAPSHLTADHLSRMAFQVVLRGFTPLIAHPERCPILSPKKREPGPQSLLGSVLRFATGTLRQHPVSRDPGQGASDLEQDLGSLLRSMGCRFQGNIGSFAGLYGERVRSRAVRFLLDGFYDCLGSDAHNPRGIDDWLPRGLAEIESRVGADGLNSLLSGSALKKSMPPQRPIGRTAVPDDNRTAVEKRGQALS